MITPQEFHDQGYYYHEAFLTQEEVAHLLSLLPTARTGVQEYPVRLVGAGLVGEALTAKLQKVNKMFFPDRDMLSIGGSFFVVYENNPKYSINLPWHQDHETFYQMQQHYYFTNFWLVLEKGDPEHSNMSVVPFNKLRDVDPVMANFTVGGGAGRFSEGRISVDITGSNYDFDFDINELAHVQPTKAGDLLLIRGDIIHRTQDQLTHRKSIGIRFVDPRTIIDRDFYYPTWPVHLKYIKSDIPQFTPFAFLFEYLDTDLLQLGEVSKYHDKLRKGELTELETRYQEFKMRYTAEIDRRIVIGNKLYKDWWAPKK